MLFGEEIPGYFYSPLSVEVFVTAFVMIAFGIGLRYVQKMQEAEDVKQAFLQKAHLEAQTHMGDAEHLEKAQAEAIMQDVNAKGSVYPGWIKKNISLCFHKGKNILLILLLGSIKKYLEKRRRIKNFRGVGEDEVIYIN